jgi:hypothetical protein
MWHVIYYRADKPVLIHNPQQLTRTGIMHAWPLSTALPVHG